MNKEYYNQWGIHLPFRFYSSRAFISEAGDTARSIHIPKTEYLIFPYGEILPFQVTRNPIPEQLFSPTFKIFCVGDETEEMQISLTEFVIEPIAFIQENNVQRISFSGKTGVNIPKGSYYAVLTDGYGNTWYSENFTVLDISEDVIFRQWTNRPIDLRTIDSNGILRIV